MVVRKYNGPIEVEEKGGRDEDIDRRGGLKGFSINLVQKKRRRITVSIPGERGREGQKNLR